MKRTLSFLLFQVCFFSQLNAQWFNLTSGTTAALNGVWFTDSVTGYVVGANGSMLKTTDGISWFPISVSANDDFNSVVFVNDSTGFVVGTYGIYKTSNSGNTWNLYTSAARLWDVFFATQLVGYACGDSGVLYKTLDCGTTWNILPTSDPGSSYRGLYFLSADTGYIVSSVLFGSVMRTVDGGVNWVSVSGNLTGARDDVWFTDQNHGYIVASPGGSVVTTIDGGNNWSFVSPGGPGLTSLEFLSDSVGYAVGGLAFSYGAIERTVDAGGTWNVQTVSAPGMLLDIYFATDSIGYSVGENGTILKTLNGGISGLAELEPSTLNICVYPNPVGTTLGISNQSGKPTTVIFRNLSGQEVQRLVVTNRYTIIDTSLWTDGIYSLTFIRDSATRTEKLIIAH